MKINVNSDTCIYIGHRWMHQTYYSSCRKQKEKTKLGNEGIKEMDSDDCSCVCDY